MDTSKTDVASAADSERCEKCGCDTKGEMAFMDHAGEYWCHPCSDNYEQNAAESAWERHCEDFHDGGCTRFNSLQDQQIEARRLK